MPHVIDLGGGRTIREIPMSVASLGKGTLPMAGGGYLRLYPLAMTHAFIRRQNREGKPAMVYFHPWEIDTEQPRRAAGLKESFQHYVNLESTAWKLDRLLDAHAFGPVRDVLASPSVAAMLAQDPVPLRAAFPDPEIAGAGIRVPLIPLPAGGLLTA
jgi:hypothetical protein